MKKIAILDEYLVDHCWIVMCDHHLHGPLLLIAHDRMRYKQDLLNCFGHYGGYHYASVDLVYDTHSSDDTPKTDCPKVAFLTLYVETPKDIATKSGETHVWNRALQSYFMPVCRTAVKKLNVFGLLGEPLGATTTDYTFLESSFYGQHLHHRQYASDTMADQYKVIYGLSHVISLRLLNVLECSGRKIAKLCIKNTLKYGVMVNNFDKSIGIKYCQKT